MKYFSHRVVAGKPAPIVPFMAATYAESLDDAQTLIVTLCDEVT